MSRDPVTSRILHKVAPKGATVWELMQSVSRTGDTRYVRLFVVHEGQISEITGAAAALVALSEMAVDGVRSKRLKHHRFVLSKDEPGGQAVKLLAQELYGDPEALKAQLL